MSGEPITLPRAGSAGTPCVSVEAPDEHNVLTAPSSTHTVNPPLFKLKLLDALKRNNYNQLKAVVASIGDATNKSDLTNVKLLILNLAVQVASVKLVQKLLSDEAADELDVDINHQDSDGNTPLHLAALNNRLDVAQLLLRDPRINDTILNDNMKQPLDLTKDLSMIRLLQHERGLYVERVALELRKAFTDHNFPALDEILAQPRNYELLDINGNDPETGDTVLHEFVKVNDDGMVQWILGHGGDPFKRDKKGRLPIDLVPRTNETLKQILRDASKDQSVLNIAKVSNPTIPTFKGYLSKWTNFASGYKLRWFVLDENGILSYYKSQDDANNACRGSLDMRTATLHLNSSEKMKFEIMGMNGFSWHLKGNHPTETSRWVWTLQGAIRYAKDKEEERKLALSTEFDHITKETEFVPIHSRTSSALPLATLMEPKPSFGVSSEQLIKSERKRSVVDEIVNDSDDDDEESETYENNGSEDILDDAGPYSQDISMAKSGFKTQIVALRDLLQNIEHGGSSEESVVISLSAVNSMIESFHELIILVEKRDDRLLRSLRKQRDVNELWINSIRDLENELIQKTNEIEMFELERKKLKKALAKNFTQSTTTVDSPAVVDGAKDVTSPIVEQAAQEELSKFFDDASDSDDEFFDADEFESEEEDDTSLVDPYVTDGVQMPEIKVEDEEGNVEEIYTELQKKKNSLIKQEQSFIGYEHQRSELGLKVDERPKVSLWGILKSMIGKDITKIALPVAFNEPTSMLQRIAEDFEYSYLMDQAVTFEDSSLRMLYFSVFAVSQYSSTIARVAKPFNPLLGETFEYARPDQGFRFFTEQVSHHPPVSAVLAEHPKWDYYGETSVKSGFNGRSFDVHPIATWYLHMRPDCGGEEVYSWTKLKTSVVGIIMGNPSIDNYGDMVIINHNTGDQCTVTFKPQGWRSSQAYEMSGIVTDKHGVKKWAIGGHWNSKIYGKKIVSDDTKIDVANKKNIASGPSDDGSKFLMWSVAPRPSVPFNLTSYAITLNDPNPELVPWIAKSDTRLRPDQRAMEDGLYDQASELKSYVEEKQRLHRKEREEKQEEYKPRYFTKEVHPLTGEEYYKYTGDYWKLRAAKDLPDPDIF